MVFWQWLISESLILVVFYCLCTKKIDWLLGVNCFKLANFGFSWRIWDFLIFLWFSNYFPALYLWIIGLEFAMMYLGTTAMGSSWASSQIKGGTDTNYFCTLIVLGIRVFFLRLIISRCILEGLSLGLYILVVYFENCTWIVRAKLFSWGYSFSKTLIRWRYLIESCSFTLQQTAYSLEVIVTLGPSFGI